jgi:hypothetical protein
VQTFEKSSFKNSATSCLQMNECHMAYGHDNASPPPS